MARTRKQHGSGGTISRVTGMLSPNGPPANVPPANGPPANVPPANVPPANGPPAWYNFHVIPINGTPYDVLMWMEHNFQFNRIFEVVPIIEEMIANGADVNETRDGLPLLHLAFRCLQFLSRRPHLDIDKKNAVILIILELLNRGVDINSVDNEGRTLLAKKLFYPNVQHVEILLSLGATITADYITGESGIDYKTLEHPGVTLLLLNSAPESVLDTLRNYKDSRGGNLLHHFIELIPEINFLNANDRELFGQGRNLDEIPNVIQKLLEIGINPDFRNRFGQTPARLAESMGLNEIAEMLKVRPERSPKTKNIYGLSNATTKRLRENQNARRAAAAAAAAGAGVGGRRRSTRRRR